MAKDSTSNTSSKKENRFGDRALSNSGQKARPFFKDSDDFNAFKDIDFSEVKTTNAFNSPKNKKRIEQLEKDAWSPSKRSKVQGFSMDVAPYKNMQSTTPPPFNFISDFGLQIEENVKPTPFSNIKNAIKSTRIESLFDNCPDIDLKTRKSKTILTVLNIVRIGTSGSLQKDIPVDSFLMSSHALDLNGMLHSYQIEEIAHQEMENAFVKHTNWSPKKAHPILIKNSTVLAKKLMSEKIYTGITATAGGFYGPQGRVLRLPLQDATVNSKIDSFSWKGSRITNLEMETSAIYGLSQLLGHHAVSMNAIIANRADGTFSKDYKSVVHNLIEYSLSKLVE